MKHYLLLARYCRYAALITERWFMIALILFFLIPYGPHVLIGGDQYGSRCHYLGSRGVVKHYPLARDCAFLMLMPAASRRP